MRLCKQITRFPGKLDDMMRLARMDVEDHCSLDYQLMPS